MSGIVSGISVSSASEPIRLASRRDAGDFALRPIAISAPHWAVRGGAEDRLGSRTPFSLLNALRGAFSRLASDASAWSRSSWSDDGVRASSITMHDYLPEAILSVSELVNRHRPNVAFVGAMTLSVPGAIACARQIRSTLGTECLIVLGGKHASETVWASGAEVEVHPAALMGDDYAGLFDLIVSGDAEDVIAEIGEAVVQVGLDGAAVRRFLGERLGSATGQFVVVSPAEPSWHVIGGSGRPRPDYPIVYEAYPINASFPALGAGPTAHAYSYTSRGCIYRCDFCSENAGVNGPVSKASLLDAAPKLARQLRRIDEIARMRGQRNPTAFVEDSVFLQGHAGAWDIFSSEVLAGGVTVPFGAQLTIDIILDNRRRPALERLVAAGLRYVFVGLETGDEVVAATMSKNTGKRSPWLDRAHSAVRALAELGVGSGVALLFGLGESSDARMALLAEIQAWRAVGGQPSVISLNWAVVHPLQDPERGNGGYAAWGTDPSDPRALILSRLFGEASVRFCMPGVSPPELTELLQIEQQYLGFRSAA